MDLVVSPYVRTFQLGAVSSKMASRFLGDDTTSCPPTLRREPFRVSATSLRVLTGNPLVGLSSLSFSQRAVLARPRVLSSTRSPSSPKKSSRRRTALNEPDGSCTRIARRLWSEPRVRIGRMCGGTSSNRRSSSRRNFGSSLSRSPRIRASDGIELQHSSPVGDFALKSLPRTGRATLVASSSTDRAQCGGRLTPPDP